MSSGIIKEMSPTLYLTADERSLYEKLGESLREGWAVETESQSFSDSPEKRQMRAELVRLSDPQLKNFRESAMKAESQDELNALMGKVDLSKLRDEDLTSLFFLAGPEVLGVLIANMLIAVQDDSGLETVSALSMLRHSLLKSLIKNA